MRGHRTEAGARRADITGRIGPRRTSRALRHRGNQSIQVSATDKAASRISTGFMAAPPRPLGASQPSAYPGQRIGPSHTTCTGPERCAATALAVAAITRGGGPTARSRGYGLRVLSGEGSPTQSSDHVAGRRPGTANPLGSRPRRRGSHRRRYPLPAIRESGAGELGHPGATCPSPSRA